MQREVVTVLRLGNLGCIGLRRIDRHRLIAPTRSANCTAMP